ncbi:MAG: stage III sporulation protein AF [Acetivibrio sp.]
MTLLLDTVRNLAMYLIFITIIKNLLGDSNYGKYVEFFMGIVLILIVLKPLSKALHTEGILEAYFNFQEINFEIKEAQNALYDGEEKVNDAILKNAEEQMKEQIINLAREEGLYVRNSKIMLSGKEDDFGRLKKIELWLSYDKDSGKIKKIAIGKEKETENFIEFEKKIGDIYEIEEKNIYVYEG